MVYTLHFFSSECNLFHNSNLFGSCIIQILFIQGVLKLKKNNSGPKRLRRALSAPYRIMGAEQPCYSSRWPPSLKVQGWWLAEFSCSTWPAVAMCHRIDGTHPRIRRHQSTLHHWWQFLFLLSPLLAKKKKLSPIKISQMCKANIFTNS